MNDAVTTTETPSAPWNAWVEELATAHVEPTPPQLRDDGRVTFAEYLQWFAQETAEFIPSWELVPLMREVNKRASAAEAAFSRTPTYNGEGTRTFHPHTLAWTMGSITTGVYEVDRRPGSNGWISGHIAAPLVLRTTEERAAHDPHFSWTTAPDYIVEAWVGAEPDGPLPFETGPSRTLSSPFGGRAFRAVALAGAASLAARSAPDAFRAALEASASLRTASTA